MSTITLQVPVPVFNKCGVDSLRGPEPVSKYENSESNSSGQNKESRRNFAAAAAAKGQKLTIFQSGLFMLYVRLAVLDFMSLAVSFGTTARASYFKQQLIPSTNLLRGLQERHCRARIGGTSCGLCWGPEQSCCVAGTFSLSMAGTSFHPPLMPHSHSSFSGTVSPHIWT